MLLSRFSDGNSDAVEEEELRVPPTGLTNCLSEIIDFSLQSLTKILSLILKLKNPQKEDIIRCYLNNAINW